MRALRPTLGGRDAAEEPTWTYSRACRPKRPHVASTRRPIGPGRSHGAQPRVVSRRDITDLRASGLSGLCSSTQPAAATASRTSAPWSAVITTHGRAGITADNCSRSSSPVRPRPDGNPPAPGPEWPPWSHSPRVIAPGIPGCSLCPTGQLSGWANA